MDLEKIKLLAQQFGVAPYKGRGQNFLLNDEIADKIIAAARLSNQDTVLEVGPGFGVLTSCLLGIAKRVVAVELDRKIVSFLRGEFSQSPNFQLVEGDILKVNLSQLSLADLNYKVVANLPYNISSHFLRVFLELKTNRPAEMILMLQKEVAERIIAQPGKMSILSVMAQFYSEPKMLFIVPSGAFWPKPKVDSAVILFKIREKLPKIDQKKLFWLVKIGFSSRRKQLQKNLAVGLEKNQTEIKAILRQCGLDEKVRAEDLTIDNWLRLVKSLSS